jgi:hypothetical protein
MKISFDLDDLLIPGTKKFDTEKQGVFQKIFKTEKLRLGTTTLFKDLKSQGHQICIYTSSLRTPYRIWLTFFLHRLTLDRIFNKTMHDKKIKNIGLSCSKYPPMFDIDLHIDDSDGVKIESQRHNFNVIIITEKDRNWTTTVLTEINKYHNDTKNNYR